MALWHFTFCEANLYVSVERDLKKDERWRRDAASLFPRKSSQEEIRTNMSEPRELVGPLGPASSISSSQDPSGAQHRK